MNEYQLHEYLFWMVGGLDFRRWEHVFGSRSGNDWYHNFMFFSQTLKHSGPGRPGGPVSRATGIRLPVSAVICFGGYYGDGGMRQWVNWLCRVGGAAHHAFV